MKLDEPQPRPYPIAPGDDATPAPREEGVPPPPPRWRPASEPTCCGSGCLDCPF